MFLTFYFNFIYRWYFQSRVWETCHSFQGTMVFLKFTTKYTNEWKSTYNFLVYRRKFSSVCNSGYIYVCIFPTRRGELTLVYRHCTSKYQQFHDKFHKLATKCCDLPPYEDKLWSKNYLSRCDLYNYIYRRFQYVSFSEDPCSKMLCRFAKVGESTCYTLQCFYFNNFPLYHTRTLEFICKLVNEVYHCGFTTGLFV